MEKENNQKEIKFPLGFLWGTSTSAYQVEGGITNDWSEWEKFEARRKKLAKKGKNPDDHICGQACDSYNRYEEDFDLAVSLNTNAIRLGIEWARIQPKKDVWDVEAISHYRSVLQAAKKRNLKTAVTLWHWTNPVWLSREGGWTNKETVSYFLNYVDLVIENLGADIDYWVTLNEPMLHVANGYISGKFPPAKHNIFKAGKVFNNLAKAHKGAYQKIHDYFPNANVGITALLTHFEPARSWFLPEKILAGIFHYFWNHRFLKNIKGEMDYIGVDYYFHDRVVWYPWFKKNINKKTTDMGWEIYPEGIYHVLKYLSAFKKPIFILENGLADKEDKERAQFIKNHLRFIYKAMKEGADVRGYFHWSLLDNFEWAEGWAPKFGLFAVDRTTFARTKRPSADVYAEICRSNSIKL